MPPSPLSIEPWSCGCTLGDERSGCDCESRILGTTQRNDVVSVVTVGCELQLHTRASQPHFGFLEGLHGVPVQSVRSPDRIFLPDGERKSCRRFTDSFRAHERVWCHSPSVQFPVGTHHFNSSLGIGTCVNQGKSFAHLSYT